MNFPKEEQEKWLNKTNIFKENNYLCGNNRPIKGFDAKGTIQYEDFVESQHFSLKKYLKEKRRVNCNVNVYICYFCGCSEGLASIDNIKIRLELTSGKVPFSLCYYCLELKTIAPKNEAQKEWK